MSRYLCKNPIFVNKNFAKNLNFFYLIFYVNNITIISMYYSIFCFSVKIHNILWGGKTKLEFEPMRKILMEKYSVEFFGVEISLIGGIGFSFFMPAIF